MRLLDLFCGAGGASMGYHRAGFEIVGVDINPQPHYPFEFHQADAMTYPLEGFDIIHASPPCQSMSLAFKGIRPDNSNKYPDLILPMRTRLVDNGVPWILENVIGAKLHMYNPVRLCGTSFGIRVQRHRYFDASHVLFGAGPCNHRPGDVSVRCQICEYLGVSYECITKKGQHIKRNPLCQIQPAREAIGIDWPMTQHELGESIPPMYTQWLGTQMLLAITQAA